MRHTHTRDKQRTGPSLEQVHVLVAVVAAVEAVTYVLHWQFHPCIRLRK